MTYASSADMTARFGEAELAQLTDPESGRQLNSAVLGRALGDAEAEIDSYLGKRYQLPLSTVPPVLQRLCCDMARYHLHTLVASETVRQRYEDAVSLLKKIASGDVELPTAAPLVVTTSGSGNMVAVSSRASVFSASALQDY